MALGDLKHDAIKFDVKGNIRSVSAKLRSICENLRAKTEPLVIKDAFRIDEIPDIVLLATGKSMIYGTWGVQIEVYDQQNKCLVVLGALGDSMLTKAAAAMAGNKQLLADSYSLTGSKKKRDKIAKALGC